MRSSEEAIAGALKGVVSAWLARRGAARMNAPATIAAPYDVEAIRRDFPILARTVYGKPLVYLDNGASAQKPKAVIDAITHAYTDEYANVHRGLHFLSNAATEKYEEAREIGPPLPQCRAYRRDHLHQERHRGDQPRRGELRHGLRRGRRDRALDHGAPLQHRAVELPPRAEGRRDQMGAGRRRRHLPDRRIREAADRPDADRRHHPHVERARHGRADEGGRADRACPRHPGAGRRQPGRGASAGRRARPRLRLLLLHRPQDLRPDRHRRALRQARAARRRCRPSWAAAR